MVLRRTTTASQDVLFDQYSEFTVQGNAPVHILGYLCPDGEEDPDGGPYSLDDIMEMQQMGTLPGHEDEDDEDEDEEDEDEDDEEDDIDDEFDSEDGIDGLDVDDEEEDSEEEEDDFQVCCLWCDTCGCMCTAIITEPHHHRRASRRGPQAQGPFAAGAREEAPSTRRRHKRGPQQKGQG